MPENDLAILAAAETIFFSRHEQRLCQWIQVTIDNASRRNLRGEVTIDAGDQRVTTALSIVPGVREYRCYAPTLWPDHAPIQDAPLRLAAEGLLARARVAVGGHRPWTVYLLSDACTDYTWRYAHEEDNSADDAALTAAEIAVADEQGDTDPANHNHYNLVHAREIQYFLSRYPDMAARLFERVKDGTIQFNAFYTMASTCDMSLEELIRQFYPARAWAREYGLDMGHANHQESPTIAWAMASVLAGSGIDHLVKSILPYECPWAARLEEPLIFFWEGPDGSRVLVRRRNEDYVEGSFVLQGRRATALALHETVIPKYERLGDNYPYNAIALVGCYGDNSPQHKDLPARKTASIIDYNAQGWDYPKLVNASHAQFWNDVDTQIAARRISVPVYRGDYGTSWDAWTTSLAASFAGWRRAQERASTADKLAAILSQLDPTWHSAHRAVLADSWMNLILLSDHAWNGANDVNRALNASLRRRCQLDANRGFDEVIASGLAALGRHVGREGAGRTLVFNSLAWPRTAIAELGPVSGAVEVIDAETGQPLASQVVGAGDQRVLHCAVPVPALGYRVVVIRPGAETAAVHGSRGNTAGYQLDGPYYTVEVSPLTGGIVRLYDKTRGRELVDAASPYHLGQCLYLSDGVEYAPRHAEMEIEPAGAVFGRAFVRAGLKNVTLTTTLTLYAHLDRLDIRHDVEKLSTSEKQELDFVFPFAVPERQYRFEAPGAFVTPGLEQRPGAGQAVTAVRHVVDVFNDEFGVTLSQTDSGFIEFGHRTTLEDPIAPDPRNSTVLAVALDNTINWREGTRDQDGVTHFTFRYSVRGHEGGFDPGAAVRFGWEDNNELLTVPLSAANLGGLPPDVHGFVEIDSASTILTTLKPAEEEGMIIRLWNCAEHEDRAVVNVSGLGAGIAANQTNLLESDGAELDTEDGKIVIRVNARALETIRLVSG